MFSSRAEYRLLLRADNAPDRLTPVAMELGLLDSVLLGSQRREHVARRCEMLDRGRELMSTLQDGEKKVCDRVFEPDYSVDCLREAIGGDMESQLGEVDDGIYQTLHADRRYEPYVKRQVIEIRRHSEMEHKPIPDWINYTTMEALRSEARAALDKYRPTTFGQASRLEGVTPSDLTLLSVLVKRARAARAEIEQV